MGLEEVASREVLEDVIERLTVLTKTTLKSTREEFQQTQKDLETLLRRLTIVSGLASSRANHARHSRDF